MPSEVAFGLESTSEIGGVFECDFFKPDECDSATSRCSMTENCETIYGRNPVGLQHACYAAWTNDTENGIKIRLKGCWLAQDVKPFDCGRSDCLAETPGSSVFRDESGSSTAYFCCCNKPRCNEHFDFPVTLPTVSQRLDVSHPSSPNSDLTSILVYIFVALSLVAMTIICFWLYRRYKLRKAVKRFARGENIGRLTLPLKIPPCPTDVSKNVELIQVVSRGRYGCVWKSKMNNELVAVKVFPMQELDSLVQEQDIYATPGLKHHPNILHYIGVDCRGQGQAQMEYWLITAYHELGSLYDYLKTHTITVPEMMKITTGMICGLAYLHEEIVSINDQQLHKPTIVHRDLKSKNVLIKNGLMACIADFGLALKCSRGRIPNNVHAQVGTRRYMAPEVLEGATEFNAFAFRQIDVYAAAIVLWETMSRCSLDGGEVDDYHLPFEEIGTKPTLQALQEHVVVRKQRPPIKPVWRKQTQCAVICSSIEEMWDPDPEARVTAGCALERFSALLETAPSPGQEECSIGSSIHAKSDKIETMPLMGAEILHLPEPKTV